MKSSKMDEEYYSMTEEALEDVDAGWAFDHQTVRDWADSLSTDNPLPCPMLVSLYRTYK